jgi:hypothetical protein
VKLLLAIRHLLAGLAILGLTLTPLARPAFAVSADMAAAASDHAPSVDNAAMAMPADMPCCPEQAPSPDCGKDCPLMALCMASVLQAAPHGAALLVPLTIASIVVPGESAKLSGLAQPPPARPPKA